MDFLSWFALVLLIFVICTLAYGMIAIHDIPYIIAKKRNHPHQDAIHYGGWVSLFTLHAIWPFLWIWASAYHPVHGYKGRPRVENELSDPEAAGDSPAENKIQPLEAKISKSSRHGSE